MSLQDEARTATTVATPKPRECRPAVEAAHATVGDGNHFGLPRCGTFERLGRQMRFVSDFTTRSHEPPGGTSGLPFAICTGMNNTRTLLCAIVLTSTCLATPLAVGCAGSSEGPSEADLAAAKEAEGERLTDADKVVDFAAGETPDTQVNEADAFPWGKTYFFAADKNIRVGKDYFPVGHELITPVGWVKTIIAFPDTVSDWFKGSNYANFTLPNTTNEPLRVNARLKLENLNWYFSRGKASLRVCNVRKTGEEYGCTKLGSVKDGTRTKSTIYDTPANWLLPRALHLRAYTRDYGLVIPPGESIHVQVKHKLECTQDPYTIPDETQHNIDCRVEPVPSIQFTKVP